MLNRKFAAKLKIKQKNAESGCKSAKMVTLVVINKTNKNKFKFNML